MNHTKSDCGIPFLRLSAPQAIALQRGAICLLPPTKLGIAKRRCVQAVWALTLEERG